MDANIFWSRVDVGSSEECWPYRGVKPGPRAHYAKCVVNGKLVQASRFVVFLTTGEWPAPDLVVLHLCDNPLCCNPAHLQVGTARDNVHDMMKKGRNTRLRSIARNGKEMLTDADIRCIRELYASGKYSQKVLAELYELTSGHICNIIKGRRRSAPW